MTKEKKAGSGLGRFAQLSTAIESAMSSTEESTKVVRAIPAPTALMNLMGAQGKPLMLNLACLVSSPYQTGELDPVRVEALVANLQNNPLNTPIVVRKVGEDSYEIVAGHHRVAAFKLLDRQAIPAILTTITDDAEIRRLVFYDNLISPELPDYVKYLGIKNLITVDNFSYSRIAEEVNKSKAWVAMLMSFEKLSVDVQSLIVKQPRKLSARNYYRLTEFSGEQLELLLPKLEEFFASEAMPFEEVLRAALRAPSSPSTVSAPSIQLVRNNAPWAAVRHRGKQVTLRFVSEEQATEFLCGLQNS